MRTAKFLSLILLVLFQTQLIKPVQSTTNISPPIAVLQRDKSKPRDSVTAVLSETTLQVPAYLWRHGCGPTALGMIAGYYDGLGFDTLFPGSAYTQTAAVNQAIASGGVVGSPYPAGSEQHFEDYSMPIDDTTYSMLTDNYITKKRTPHTDNSIADYMNTSRSTKNNRYGWSWSSDIGSAWLKYVRQQNITYTPTYQLFYTYNATMTWAKLVSEIDAGRPMICLVDSDASGVSDHFVAVIGYRTSPRQQYGSLDTWYKAVRWENFTYMASGVAWGIWGCWQLQIQKQPSIYLPFVRKQGD